jgi:hypothetical protein
MPYHAIRRVRIAHCKRGPSRCDKCREMDAERICLLEIWPPGEGEMQRRVLSMEENGVQVWREFDIVRSFESGEEAQIYAEQHGIDDVEL